MAINIKALREEFSTLEKAYKDRTEKFAAAEKVTDEEKSTHDSEQAKAFARMERIKQLIEEDVKIAGLALKENKAVTPAETPGEKEYAQISVGDTYQNGRKITRELFQKQFNVWGKGAVHLMDRQFATITGATQSGIFLPTEVDEPLTPSYLNTFRAAHNVLGVPVFQTQNTATINLPVMEASAGGVVAENATVGTIGNNDNVPTLTNSFALSVSTYQSGEVWYSNQQLNAVDFDLFSATLPVLEFQKELGLESAIVNHMIADGNITQVQTTSTASGFTFPDLVSASNLLPKRFQMKKFIVLSATAYAAFQGLVTSTGQPVMTWVDPVNSKPLALQDTPVFRSDYFSALGANNVIGAVVSLAGFRLRDCAGESVARYTQFPARPSQTGYNLFAYHGYGYAPPAVALIKCHS